MRLMVIGDSDLPPEHRWAILRPHDDGEPIVAMKQQWARDLPTLSEALAAVPALTADNTGAGVQRLTIHARHPERRAMSYCRRGA